MDSIEPSEPMDSTEPADPIDSTDPALPIDSTDPAEPIDSTDPAEPIERIDPIDPIDPIDQIEPMDPAPGSSWRSEPGCWGMGTCRTGPDSPLPAPLSTRPPRGAIRRVDHVGAGYLADESIRARRHEGACTAC